MHCILSISDMLLWVIHALWKLLDVSNVLLLILPCARLYSCVEGFQLVCLKSHTSFASSNQMVSTKWIRTGPPEGWHAHFCQVSKRSWGCPAPTTPTSASDQGRLDLIKGGYTTTESPVLPCPTRYNSIYSSTREAVGQMSLTEL